MTDTRLSLLDRLLARPGLAGFGVGAVAGLVLLVETWIIGQSEEASAVLFPAMLATSFGFGMLAGVVARREIGWGGMAAALVGSAVVIAVVNAASRPENPYAQGTWATFVVALIAGLSVGGASIGFGVVVLERRLRFPVWLQVVVPPVAIGVTVLIANGWQAWSLANACAPPGQIEGLSGRLAYRSPQGTICVADLAAGSVEQIHPGEGAPVDPLREPTWMPGGQSVLAVRGSDFGDDELVTIEPDGRLSRFARVKGLRFDDPAWSPDGSQIAISAWTDWPPQLYLVSADGSEWENLADRTTVDEVSHPTWSPDGLSLAFVGTNYLDAALYVLDLAPDALPRRLAEASFDGSPSWSPDGRWIAFEDRDPDQAISSIYLIRPDGSDFHQIIASDGEDNYHPAWSPDGQWLAFLRQKSFEEGAASIWVADTTGHNPRPVAKNATAAQQTLDRGPSLDWAAP